MPTAELIARAEAHREAVYRAYPHLRPDPPPPDPEPGSDAWLGLTSVPPDFTEADARLAARAFAQQAQAEAPTVWQAVCHLLELVAELHATVAALADHEGGSS